MEKNKYDRKSVISYDDRLHPILNIDAVARMLVIHADGPTILKLGPFRTALCRYTGRYNYNPYWNNVKRFMRLLEDTSYIQKIAEHFNKLNPNLKINGKPATFNDYIAVCQQQNLNYGLEEYSRQNKYLSKNSVVMLKTYRKFL